MTKNQLLFVLLIEETSILPVKKGCIGQDFSRGRQVDRTPTWQMIN